MFISYICSLSLILTHAIIFSVAFILFNILSVCNDISFLLFRSLFYVGISQISFDNPREPCVIWKAQFSSTPLYGKYNCLYIYNFTSLVLYCIHSLYCITFPLQLIRLRFGHVWSGRLNFLAHHSTVNIIVSISIISHLSFYIASTHCIALRFPYSSSVCDLVMCDLEGSIF